MDLTRGSGISPGERHGNPLQYSCLENPMDRGGHRATAHGVAKSRTQLKTQTHFKGFPGDSMAKNPPANAGNSGLISG